MSSLDVIKLLLAKGAEVNLQLKNAPTLPHEARSRYGRNARRRHDASHSRREGRRPRRDEAAVREGRRSRNSQRAMASLR